MSSSQDKTFHITHVRVGSCEPALIGPSEIASQELKSVYPPVSKAGSCAYPLRFVQI